MKNDTVKRWLKMVLAIGIGLVFIVLAVGISATVSAPR